jgi:hypothetical protein
VCYGKIFPDANLENFCHFYVAYADPIRCPVGSEFSRATSLLPTPGKLLIFDFVPSWLHYRSERVGESETRRFYEEKCASFL